MAYSIGRFVWRELLTTDPTAAKAFYGEAFGWQAKEVPMGDMNYTLFSANGQDVAGMMKLPMPEVPPHWYGYVSVEDVDAAVARAEKAGGKVIVPAKDIPNVGRFAILLDDQGAPSSPFRAATGDREPGVPKLGEFCWESINTADLAKTIAFYTTAYGWKTAPFGDITTFGVGEGPQNQVASITPAPPGVPTHWLSYVVVDKLASARDRIKRLGGSIMVDSIHVPGVGTFAVAQDPQKAIICPFEGEQPG